MNKSTDLLTGFLRYISVNQLFHQHDQLLLAVSGGLDSAVLCDLCSKAGFRFMMAHCNFGLRGEESTRDALFVRELAAAYQVKLLIREFNTAQYAEENRKSIQVAARELRYAWFQEVTSVKQVDLPFVEQEAEKETSDTPAPRFIVTAHHADDNVETVMMNFFKGTGVAGLRGILPAQGNLVRPLLFAWKEELGVYAEAHKLRYVEDSSNLSDKYTRNYFRNQLIPALQQIFPAVKENLQSAIPRYRDTEHLYNEAIEYHKKKLVEVKGNDLHIPVLKLKKIPAFHTLVYELLKPYGFSAHQSEEVTRLLDSESGRFVQSATHRVIKNRNWLVITALREQHTALIVIEPSNKKITFSGGKLELRELNPANINLPFPPDKAALDARHIRFPLILRRWRQGDYFYPLGLKKKKKISRFLIDQKLSLPEKENTWVLEMERKIIWVVNRRIDDRFKVTDSTEKVLHISFSATGS